MADPTISQILAELGVDPKTWENAGAQEQLMVVFCWGGDHGKSFDCSEICKLLKLPEDVVLTVLDELMKCGVVHTRQGIKGSGSG